MEKRNLPFEELIRQAKENDEAAARKLYKRLFDMCFDYIHEQGVKDGQVEIFQDAFLVFEKKLKTDRLVFPGDEPEMRSALRARKYFERILDRLIFNVERSIHQVVEGVKKGHSFATQRLATYLQNDYFQQYTRNQVNRFQLSTVEAGDFLSEASTILLDKIADGGFTLEAGLDNDHNKKRLSSFFYQIIFRQISKWKRDQQRKSDRAMTYASEMEMIDDDPVTIEETSVFEMKVLELLHNLDEAGRYILRASYLDGLTPKQIAKKIPYEEYQETQKVNEKKVSSLKKLSADLFVIRKSFGKEDLRKLKEITQAVLTALAEPCKTILHYAFPPESRTPAEIAVLLQQTRPQEEVGNLSTAAQVKKRKYKCKLTLWDSLWENMITAENL